MTRTKTILLLLVGVLFLLYIFMPQIVVKRTQSLSATIYSMNSRGIKIFNEIAKELGIKVSVQKSPLFEETQLDQYAALFLLSPNKNYSKKEISKIDQFVRTGGSLVLLIESELHLSYFEKLLATMFKDKRKSIKLEEFIDYNKKFTLYEPTEQSPLNDDALFKENETYQFYSSLIFKDNPGKVNFESYYRNFVIGNGQMHIFLGLAPFSNVLIDKMNNFDMSKRLLTQYNSILIDEFRHFYSSKSWRDLFSLSFFLYPFLAMCLLTFVYFYFGESPERKAKDFILKKVPYQKKDLHKVNQDYLSKDFSLMRFSQMLDKQYEELSRLFIHSPQFQKELGSINFATAEDKKTALALAKKLTKLHRKYIKHMTTGN